MTDSRTLPTSADSRSAAIEWLRLLGCLGIVAFHMQVPWPLVAISGLYAFSIITVALAAKSARGRRLASYAAARFRTLLVPWLFWSAFYAVVLMVFAVRHGQSAFSWVEPRMLLTGPVIHLWFLPFAYAASVGVAAAVILRKRPLSHASAAGKSNRGRWIEETAIALGCAASIAAAELVMSNTDYPAPFAQWVSVLPGVPIGAFLATLNFGERRNARPLSMLAICCGAAGAALALAGHQMCSVGYLISVPACAAAWLFSAPAGRGTLRWSKLSFGIYLLHPFFGLVCYKMMSTSNTNLAALVVCAMSLLATAALRATPLRRVL